MVVISGTSSALPVPFRVSAPRLPAPVETAPALCPSWITSKLPLSSSARHPPPACAVSPRKSTSSEVASARATGAMVISSTAQAARATSLIQTLFIKPMPPLRQA